MTQATIEQEKQATIYKNAGISSVNYSKYISDIKNKLEEYKVGDPVLTNKIIASVYDQLVYEENEPIMVINDNEVETMCFESRKEMRLAYIERLKKEMDSLAVLEKDTTKPKAYRRKIALQIVSKTAMYEALSNYSIENIKECFEKSKGNISTFAATHSIVQFPGEPHGLEANSMVTAVFYDGISGDPDLLLKLNQTEDEKDQRSIIEENIKLVGIVYEVGQQEPRWALITDETPYMHLLLLGGNQ